MADHKFDIQLTNAPGDKIALDLGVTLERSETINRAIAHNLALKLSSGEGTTTAVMKAIVRECETLEEVVWSIFAMTKAMDVYDAVLGVKSSTNTTMLADYISGPKKKPVTLANLKEEWKSTAKPEKEANKVSKPEPLTSSTVEPFRLYVDTSIGDFYGAFGLTEKRGKEIDNYVKDYIKYTRGEGKLDLRYAMEEVVNNNSLNKQEAAIAIYILGHVLGKILEAGMAKGE